MSRVKAEDRAYVVAFVPKVRGYITNLYMYTYSESSSVTPYFGLTHYEWDTFTGTLEEARKFQAFILRHPPLRVLGRCDKNTKLLEGYPTIIKVTKVDAMRATLLGMSEATSEVPERFPVKPVSDEHSVGYIGA